MSKVVIIFVFVILGGMFYFYNNPILLPSNFSLEILPENIKETVDDTTKKISEGFENEFSKATEGFKPEFDSSRMEYLIHELTNEKRAEHDLSILEPDSKLSDITRLHSYDMGNRDYFAHVNPEGLNPTDRAKRADYSCIKFYGVYYTDGVAENLAKNWLFTSYMMRGNYISYNWHTEESLVNEIVDGWMASPGHRKNILTPEFDKLGVGIVITDNNAVYASQNFC